MSLSGRLAIVTGGGSGIGRAVCYALADEGATVIVADIDGGAAGNTAVELPGEGHQALEVDVREMTSVLALFENVCDSCSTPVSIVINSAGVIKATKVVEMEEDSFDDEVRTNLKGTFLVNQAAVKDMLSSGVPEGCIVNVSSIGFKTGFPSYSAHTASMAGVVAFTKSLAQELVETSIRVNALVAGPTDTPMIADVPDDVKEKVVASIPLRRLARPEEIAEVAKFLCCPGSSFVTGTAVEVAGGYCA